MATHAYNYGTKAVRFVNFQPVAEDIGRALDLPTSVVDTAIQLVDPANKITAPLNTLDPSTGVDTLVTVLTPTGVSQLTTGLGVGLAVGTAVATFVANAISNLDYQDKKRRSKYSCCHILQ